MNVETQGLDGMPFGLLGWDHSTELCEPTERGNTNWLVDDFKMAVSGYVRIVVQRIGRGSIGKTSSMKQGRLYVRASPSSLVRLKKFQPRRSLARSWP